MSDFTVKLKLIPEYWNRPPSISVILNKECCIKKSIIEEQTLECKFDSALLQEENYLAVQRYGKTNEDTIINENNEVVKDSVLHISGVEINDIDLGNIVYTIPFFPEYPEPWATQQKNNGNILPTSVKPCTSIFHNGEWRITWTEPFHLWYLENLWN